jgi:hypothetical protein
MEATRGGILIEVKDSHPRKHSTPKVLIVSKSVIDLRDLQLLKQQSEMKERE